MGKWKKYTTQAWAFIIGGIYSYIFILAITESVQNSTFVMKMLWKLLVPLFTITDVIVYAKTGEEIISSILEWFGIDLE